MFYAYDLDTKVIVAQSEKEELLDMYANDYGVCSEESAAFGFVEGLKFENNYAPTIVI